MSDSNIAYTKDAQGRINGTLEDVVITAQNNQRTTKQDATGIKWYEALFGAIPAITTGVTGIITATKTGGNNTSNTNTGREPAEGTGKKLLGFDNPIVIILIIGIFLAMGSMFFKSMQNDNK